jgi:hypothetical protein
MVVIELRPDALVGTLFIGRLLDRFHSGLPSLNITPSSCLSVYHMTRLERIENLVDISVFSACVLPLTSQAHARGFAVLVVEATIRLTVEFGDIRITGGMETMSGDEVVARALLSILGFALPVMGLQLTRVRRVFATRPIVSRLVLAQVGPRGGVVGKGRSIVQACVQVPADVFTLELYIHRPA